MLQPHLSSGYIEFVIVEPSMNQELRKNIFDDFVLMDSETGESIFVFLENIHQLVRPLRVRAIQISR